VSEEPTRVEHFIMTPYGHSWPYSKTFDVPETNKPLPQH